MKSLVRLARGISMNILVRSSALLGALVVVACDSATEKADPMAFDAGQQGGLDAGQVGGSDSALPDDTMGDGATAFDAAAPREAGQSTDAAASPTCSDGEQNGDELGVDCGSACGAPCSDVFTADEHTLAIFELNGDLLDSSGHGRHALPTREPSDAGAGAQTLDPVRFVQTSWGQGLTLPGTPYQGFDWSAHASLLSAPFTMEIVLVPSETDCYQRLFAFDAEDDDGWYLCDGFEAYPNDALLGTDFAEGERLYLAIVMSTELDADAGTGAAITVYKNGTLLGTSQGAFVAPPTDAVFFEDDNHRGEQPNGVVDAVRLSSGARSAEEISATWTRLTGQPIPAVSDAGVSDAGVSDAAP